MREQAVLCILEICDMSSLQLFWDGFGPTLGGSGSTLGILELFRRYSMHKASTVRQTLATVTNVVVNKVSVA